MRTLIAAALVLLLALPAAGKDILSDTAEAAANGNNAFGLDLYKRLDANGNLFFSPYSVSAALAMVAEGARGETRDQIDAVFHFPAELAQAHQNLRIALKPRQVPGTSACTTAASRRWSTRSH